jgi:hypothetical protein
MNKRPIYIASIYSTLVIVFKLAIVLGGFLETRFWFMGSHIVSVFFIIPFIWLAIKLVRDKDYGGVIMGREAFVAGLMVVALSAVIISVYHYIEFEWKLRDFAVNYYNSAEFQADMLKHNPNVKPEQYPTLMKKQLESLSAFKAITAKLLSFFLVGVSSSFLCAAFMKK